MEVYENIKHELIDLGINHGDTLFIRGNLAKVGRIKKDIFINTLLNVVGEEGTIVTLSFTKSFPFYRIDKNYIFNFNTIPNTGSIGKAFLEHPNVSRSLHPTNSFMAIGKKADMILENHNELSMSYDPMYKIVSLNAKMINIGITSESPGFTTVHLAQQELGLTKKSILKNLLRVYYKSSNNQIKLFKRQDVGGCSDGFGKFYQYYLDKDKLVFGKLGNTNAIVGNAKDIYEIDLELIKRDNSFHFCDNPLCFVCRCTWKYDFKYLPNYLIIKFISLFKKDKK
ncbi:MULTISPECIES: AAC(3) family N-acetyltransferase [Aliarcobacter]|uniref:AAC(3) family N-acetyltransferase n=1 Tax=Aliarcobacter TaxID=2321111 RepID=UPI00112F7AC0|nr:MULTISPECIES: AAC(3) family N-acetyltransferase [Aliarcobacter]MDX4048470.1 AAC(3) family N-acetyltransferase [Aliarcobacter skirrowii]